MLQEIGPVSIATSAGGAATVYIGHKIRGRLIALKYAPGTIDTGAGLTITGETSGVPILVKANAGTSTVFYYPRVIPNKNTDGSAFTDVAEPIHLFRERIKVVVASGGATKAGTITAYVDEEK